MSENSTVNPTEYGTFGAEDYVLFVLMLLTSVGIGVYFGFFAKQSNTTQEYLLGGNRMKTIPIGISLVASQISAIAFMAVPAEVYSFGINEAFGIFCMVVCIPFLCWVTTPIFYNNNISNCYEYLELRFDRRTRRCMTAIYVLGVCLSLPVFMYIPSLAFSQVTGVNIYLINGAVCFICVFYTMLGGIKAVVWTDVIQGLIMLCSVILVSSLATHQIGGFGKVFEYAQEGGRLQPFTNFDLTTRVTVWNAFVGNVFLWTSYVGFSQSSVQRIVALPSLGHAKRALLLFGFGYIAIVTLSYTIGIILFARYHDCDPVQAGLVTKSDQLMPFFVQDVVGHWKGMPGIFISAVFSASLSTMSANLNSLSGIVYFDYVKPFINHTEGEANLIMKAIVFIAGFYSFMGGLVVGNFKSLLQIFLTILGLTYGAILGTFSLGMFVPRAHGSAGFYGMLFSLAALTWIIVGSQLKAQSGEFQYFPLPTRVDGCDAHNITVLNLKSQNTTSAPSQDNNISFSLYTISFHWYKPIGAICVWIMAIPLSYLTTPSEDKTCDPKLLIPWVRRFLPTKPGRIPEEVPLRNANQKPY